MKPTKLSPAKSLRDRFEIRRMGKYQLQYDTIVDHDTYNWLRVTLEVARDDMTKATVVLNGTPIGIVKSRINKNNEIIAFEAFRLDNDIEVKVGGHLFTEIGHAAASIISTYVI